MYASNNADQRQIDSCSTIVAAVTNGKSSVENSRVQPTQIQRGIQHNVDDNQTQLSGQSNYIEAAPGTITSIYRNTASLFVTQFNWITLPKWVKGGWYSISNNLAWLGWQKNEIKVL
jgi:hypothetical protein